MCMGTPMQVVRCQHFMALCDNQGQCEQVDISLVGAQPAGTWLLVFLGAAREVMEPEDARKSLDAINALRQVMQGSDQVSHLFADLVDREPCLPEHLRSAQAASGASHYNAACHVDTSHVDTGE